MLKNENVLGDMIDILDGLHRHIQPPKTLDVCTEGGHTRAVEVKLHNFSYIPLGGDQLTIARIWGSQSILQTQTMVKNVLRGLYLW